MGFVGHIVVLAGLAVVCASVISLMDWKGMGQEPWDHAWSAIPIGVAIVGLGAFLIAKANDGQTWSSFGLEWLTVCVALIAAIASFAAANAAKQATQLSKQAFQSERDQFREQLIVVPRLECIVEGQSPDWEMRLAGTIEVVNTNQVPAVLQTWSSEIFYRKGRAEKVPTKDSGFVSLVVPPKSSVEFQTRATNFVRDHASVEAYAFSVRTAEDNVFTTMALNFPMLSTKAVRAVTAPLLYQATGSDVRQFVNTGIWPTRS